MTLPKEVVPALDRTLDAHQTEQFGQRLRALREGRRWSTRELASRAGIANGAVSQLESGTTSPRLTTMLALVRAFELRSIEELLGPLPTGLLTGHDPPNGIW